MKRIFVGTAVFATSLLLISCGKPAEKADAAAAEATAETSTAAAAADTAADAAATAMDAAAEAGDYGTEASARGGISSVPQPNAAPIVASPPPVPGPVKK